MPPKINRLGAALPAATQIEEISSPGDIIFDCLGYTFLSVMVFGNGTAAIQTSVSNDKINWVGINLDIPSNLGTVTSDTPLVWARRYTVSDRYLKLTFDTLANPPLKICGCLSSGAANASGGGGGGSTDVSALLKEGTPITGETLETGGASAVGWLSSIRKLIVSRLPTLVSGKLPVDVNFPTTQQVAGTVSVGEIVDGIEIDGVALPSGSRLRGWLSAIWKLLNDRFPSLGTKTADFSLPVAIASDQTVKSTASLSDIAVQLQAILNFIARPLWVNPTNSNVNVNVANGTLPSVTTVSSVTSVSTVASITNLNSQPIQNTLMYDTGRTSWVLTIRSRIT